jgi:radical SAM protein with 4Fe4S-binding SPASM domain
MDKKSFLRFKQQVGRQRAARGVSASEILAKSPQPYEIGLQLTYRCNLRCVECFQWGEAGSYIDNEAAAIGPEIPVPVVESLLRETEATRAAIYLWGGEPLMYRDWDQLAQLLARHRRHVVLCTNGIGIERRLDSIETFSDDLVVLLSVDGLREANDAIRGRNTFQNILKGIDSMLKRRHDGSFRGAIAVSCVLNKENIDELPEFIEYFAGLGVDAVYIVFPWHIGEPTAAQMDGYFSSMTPAIRRITLHGGAPQASWHHFRYGIGAEHAPRVREVVRQIKEKDWPILVRFQPDVSDADIEVMISGSGRPVQGRVRCLSKFHRISVLPNGDVTPCKLFPEFTVGNLVRQSFAEVWRAEPYCKMTKTLDRELTPVCGKCVQLYLDGISEYQGVNGE